MPPLCPRGGRASSVYQHVHRLNHSSIELQCEKDENIITTHAWKRYYTNQRTIGRLSADSPKRKVVTAANQKILELLILRLWPDKGKLWHKSERDGRLALFKFVDVHMHTNAGGEKYGVQGMRRIAYLVGVLFCRARGLVIVVSIRHRKMRCEVFH